MESIITFIVILLIGSLFGGKKNKKQTEQKQAKPFTAQPNEEPSPFKKLKEMSQEMYRELQQEMQQETEPERKQQPTVVRRSEVFTPPAAPAPVAVSRPTERSRQSTRKTRDQLTTNHRRTRQQARKTKETVVTVSKTESLLPKTEEDIMKGIIFSEIFGPPKSKR